MTTELPKQVPGGVGVYKIAAQSRTDSNDFGQGVVVRKTDVTDLPKTGEWYKGGIVASVEKKGKSYHVTTRTPTEVEELAAKVRSIHAEIYGGHDGGRSDVTDADIGGDFDLIEARHALEGAKLRVKKASPSEIARHESATPRRLNADLGVLNGLPYRAFAAVGDRVLFKTPAFDATSYSASHVRDIASGVATDATLTADAAGRIVAELDGFTGVAPQPAGPNPEGGSMTTTDLQPVDLTSYGLNQDPTDPNVWYAPPSGRSSAWRPVTADQAAVMIASGELKRAEEPEEPSDGTPATYSVGGKAKATTYGEMKKWRAKKGMQHITQHGRSRMVPGAGDEGGQVEAQPHAKGHRLPHIGVVVDFRRVGQDNEYLVRPLTSAEKHADDIASAEAALSALSRANPDDNYDHEQMAARMTAAKDRLARLQGGAPETPAKQTAKTAGPNPEGGSMTTASRHEAIITPAMNEIMAGAKATPKQNPYQAPDHASNQAFTQSQIDDLLDFYPEMRSEGWWKQNAASNPIRAVSHRLEQLADDKRKVSAKKYTPDEMAKGARDYRAGKVVNDDLIVQAVQHGHLTDSEAMNRDW